MNSLEDIKKVCIVGIDALEHDLVEKWDLESLKQEEYGKLEVPKSEHSAPYTSEVWPSFLSGKLPEEHGIREDRDWGFLVNSFAKFKWFLQRDLGLNLPFTPTKTTAEKLGFSYKPADNTDIDTFLDFVPDSIWLPVPGYKEEEDILELRTMEIKAHENGEVTREDVKNKALDIFEEKKKKTFKKLEKGWRLFMTYFYLLDPLQHTYHYDEEYIRKIYEDVEETVDEIKEGINDEDTLVIIVSDHGQKEGVHTNYGFYSLNKELNLQDPKITDFYDLIAEIFNVPSDEEEEKIKKHLEELGYI